MSYADLIRKAWGTGKFIASKDDGSAPRDRRVEDSGKGERLARGPAPRDRRFGDLEKGEQPARGPAPRDKRVEDSGKGERLARGRIRGEMEEIVRREAAEALSCLARDQGGTMKLAPFVKFREEKFGAVLFETRSERVYTLNPTAAAVVREILSGADEKTLTKRLRFSFDDKKSSMEGEVLALVKQLKEKGLITD